MCSGFTRFISDEYSGGIYENRCPGCGQFVKDPGWYKPEFKYKSLRTSNGEWDVPVFIGAFAYSYCKRCKKDIKLQVEFI